MLMNEPGIRSWPSSRNSRRCPTNIGVLETLCLPEERFGAGANIVVG